MDGDGDHEWSNWMQPPPRTPHRLHLIIMGHLEADSPAASTGPPKRRNISYVNLAIGSSLNIFEVSTLGQPFEVIKTHLAANRQDSMLQALKKTYGRGGIVGFYQGLIPWFEHSLFGNG